MTDNTLEVYLSVTVVTRDHGTCPVNRCHAGHTSRKRERIVTLVTLVCSCEVLNLKIKCYIKIYNIYIYFNIIYFNVIYQKEQDLRYIPSQFLGKWVCDLSEAFKHISTFCCAVKIPAVIKIIKILILSSTNIHTHTHTQYVLCDIFEGE